MDSEGREEAGEARRGERSDGTMQGDKRCQPRVYPQPYRKDDTDGGKQPVNIGGTLYTCQLAGCSPQKGRLRRSGWKREVARRPGQDAASVGGQHRTHAPPHSRE